MPCTSIQATKNNSPYPMQNSKNRIQRIYL